MENRTELFHSIPPLPSPLPISPHTTPDLDLTPEKEYPQKTTKETHWNTKTKSRALKKLNVPSDVTRYTNLPQLDISDNSFEQLVLQYKPHKRHRVTKQSTTEEPHLSTYTTPYIVEEPCWTRNDPLHESHPFTGPSHLYHIIKSNEV